MAAGKSRSVWDFLHWIQKAECQWDECRYCPSVVSYLPDLILTRCSLIMIWGLRKQQKLKWTWSSCCTEHARPNICGIKTSPIETHEQRSAKLSASVSTSRGRLCRLKPISVLVSKIETVYHKSRYRSCLLRQKLFSLSLGLVFWDWSFSVSVSKVKKLMSQISAGK